jgi:hypothetical protein
VCDDFINSGEWVTCADSFKGLERAWKYDRNKIWERIEVCESNVRVEWIILLERFRLWEWVYYSDSCGTEDRIKNEDGNT